MLKREEEREMCYSVNKLPAPYAVYFSELFYSSLPPKFSPAIGKENSHNTLK
jgi:hypothetical protein